MSVLDLLQVQAAKETTWGTAVPVATAKWMGVTSMKVKPTGKTKVLRDIRGSLAPGYVAARQSIGAEATMEGFATYEDLCYLIEGLWGVATPTGAGPYVRAYVGALGSAIVPRLHTLQYGDASNIYQVTSAMVNKLTLTAKGGENDTELTYSAEFLGKEVVTGTLTALSDRTVTPIMGNTLALYIDAWGGTVGTTLITPSAYDIELTFDANRLIKRYLGSLSPGGYDGRAFMPENNTLKMNLEFTAGNKAYFDAIIGSSVFQKQVRLKFTDGAGIAQFDFAGTCTEDPEIFNDQDGVASIEMNLQGTYNSGLANWHKCSMTNSVAELV